MPFQQEKDLKRLDELLANLGGSDDPGKRSAGPCGLLLERLRVARRNLLGSMLAEYVFSLEQSEKSVACILDKDARSRARTILRSLIESGASRYSGRPL